MQKNWFHYTIVLYCTQEKHCRFNARKQKKNSRYELSTFFNNILVLPTIRSLNIGFQYRPRAQEVTVE